MPNQANSGIMIYPWGWCDKCGLQYRLNQLQRENGFLVCHECLDDRDVEYRPQIIADVLGDGRKDADVAPQLKEKDDDDNPWQ